MLTNVNKFHNFEACLHFLALGSTHNQDDSSISMGDLSRKFPY